MAALGPRTILTRDLKRKRKNWKMHHHRTIQGSMCASYVQCGSTDLLRLLIPGVGVPESTTVFKRGEKLPNLWIDLCEGA